MRCGSPRNRTVRCVAVRKTTVAVRCSPWEPWRFVDPWSTLGLGAADVTEFNDGIEGSEALAGDAVTAADEFGGGTNPIHSPGSNREPGAGIPRGCDGADSWPPGEAPENGRGLGVEDQIGAGCRLCPEGDILHGTDSNWDAHARRRQMMGVRVLGTDTSCRVRNQLRRTY